MAMTGEDGEGTMKRWRSGACGLVAVGVAFVLGGFSSGVGAQTGDGAGLLARKANLEVERVSIIDALRRLQALSAVPIGFSPESIPSDRRVSCRCTDRTVEEALEILLDGTGLVFAGRRNQILVIRPNEPEPPRPETGVVGGFVREVETGAPVASARVELRELRVATITNARGTLTDDRGSFEIASVLPGTYLLLVRALGYEDQSLSVLVAAGVETRVNLMLIIAPLSLNEIVVAPGRFGFSDGLVGPGRASLTMAHFEAGPQFGDDVFRTMKRMPGMAGDDISAALSVRGAQPRNTLILLDGMELFEPYHLKDFDGLFGIVDNRTLAGIELFTGGFGAEYGDHTAGVLSMRTRQPAQRRRTSVGVSLTSAGVTSEGPFEEGKGSWLVSARRGYLDLLLGLTGNGPQDGSNESFVPRYYDVFGRVTYAISPGHEVTLNLLHSGDENSFVNSDGIDDERNEYRLDSSYGSTYGWVTWTAQVGSDLEATSRLSWTGVSRDRRAEKIPFQTHRSREFSEYNAYLETDVADFGSLEIRQDWNLPVADRVHLSAGARLRSGRAEYEYASRADRLDFLDGEFVEARDSSSVVADPDGVDLGAYVTAKVRGTGRLTVEAGLRADRGPTHDFGLSPRLMGAFELTPDLRLTASWGEYRQPQGLAELRVADGESQFSPTARARLSALGLAWRVAAADLRLEVYRRKTRDPLPVFVDLQRGTEQAPSLSSGRYAYRPTKGRASGFEISSTNADRGGAWEWAAYYAWSDAEERVDGAWVPGSYSQKHTLGLNGTARRGGNWTFSAGWYFHTGWATTPQRFSVLTGLCPPPESATATCDFVDRTFGPLNSDRLPNYQRLDVRATRTFQFARSSLDAYLEIFNLTGSTNPRAYVWDLSINDHQLVQRLNENGGTGLPFLPSIGLRWVF